MNPEERQIRGAKSSKGKRLRSLSSEVFADLQKDQWLHHEFERHIEALIRPVVADAVDSTLRRVLSANFRGREPLKQITEFSKRTLRLRFKTNPAAVTFTKSILVDEDDNTISVVLIDTATDQPVTTGPGSVAKLEVVPLMGDFDTPEEQEWSAEDFEAHVVKAREDKGPLLDGDLDVHLQEGVGTLGQLYFTDNSSFTRSKKFRLGVRVARDNAHELMSIREGKSWAFTVKENRGKEYMKHATPFPADDVWRLRHIRKNGAHHKRLRENGINTVDDFLSCLETNPELLKNVLSTMCKKDFQDTIHHAKQCVLGNTVCLYQVEQAPYETLIFNPSNCQVMGAITQAGRYVGLGMVDDDAEKVRIDGLVKSAYNHWDDVTEWTLENVAEPSMIGAVDGSMENNMIVDVAATLHEDPDGSFDVEGVAGFEPIAGPDHADGDAEELEAASQEQSSGFDMADLSDDLRMQLEGLNSSIADGEVASQVRDIISEELYGEPQEPNPAASAWWLRIRSAVRCALFLRRARFAAARN